jgi:hypothetical protein
VLDEAAPAKRLAHLPRPAGGEKGAQSKQLQQKAQPIAVSIG